MSVLLTERWPHARGPAPDSSPDAEQAQEILGEMAALLRDSRPGVLICSASAGAIAIGTAIEAVTLPLTSRSGPGIAVVGGVFLILVVCLLRTVTLLMMSGARLGHTLGQQRLYTGAPLDPRAPWATIPAPGEADGIEGPWGWTRAHLLLSQARFRVARIQAALNWALVTTGVFLAWTGALMFIR